MSWDNYSDSEAFYQGMLVPLGSSWSIYARAGYNVMNSRLDEMYYRLTFANNCCYRIDFSYRDDLVGLDDWAGVVFVINAFPSHPFFFNTKQISEIDQ
jgi:LPS-assembly protein